ncbi:MAG: aspartyl protease family protein [Saprospiraceae bacterium]|nr:aspartyl protease family protein [Lewinella sp.]
MRKILFLLLCCLAISSSLTAQVPDLILRKNAQKAEVPFEYENGFIVVRVVFNNIFPLKFILDTGAEHTILTKREITDLLQVDYQRRFVIMGSDLKTELGAYLVRGIVLTMGNMYLSNRSMLVLEDDYFSFDEFAGLDVHGIIGADLLRRFIMMIDYRKKTITFYDPSKFTMPHGKFTELEVELHRNKPYIYTHTDLPRDTSARLKYLMDTGASVALMMYTVTDTLLQLPEQFIRSNIGMGLGGFIEGFVGRTPEIDIGNTKLQEVVTNYQDFLPTMDSAYFNKRNGLIGNQVLSRFTVIVDYIKGKVYVAPNGKANQKFRYDRSGLSLVASGPQLEDITVFAVTPETPASEAGMKKGDIIKKINGVPSAFTGLQGTINRLKKRPGKRIQLICERDGERIKVRFRLRDLI